MARHPGTEGNELHPSDVIIPDPSGGDGRLSVRNDLAAEFAGLAISSTQPTDMPNGGVWVNLSAEPTGIDRLQTYDESTDAFIPISADSTVVSEEEPEPEIGLLWFEPVDDGANLYASSSDKWEFLQFIPAIPDTVVAQYDPATFSTDDSIWSDDVGDNDATLQGDLQGSTFADGSESIEGDGVDDAGQANWSVNGAELNSWSFEFEIQYSHTNREIPFGTVQSNDQGFWFEVNKDEDFNDDNGNLRITLQDQNVDGRIRFAASTNPSLNDGNKHIVSIVFNDASNNDYQLFIDGSEVSTSANTESGPSNFETWTDDLGFWSRVVDGSLDNYFNGQLGLTRTHDSSISEQTIE